MEDVGISTFAILPPDTLLIEPTSEMNHVMPLDAYDSFETLHAPSYTCGFMAGYCWAGGTIE